MTRLTEKLFKADQSWIYETLWDLGRGRRCRIRVRRNAYDFQSYARAELFDHKGEAWNEVASTDGSMLKCLPASYVMSEERIRREYFDLFKQDTALLLAEVGMTVKR